MVYAQVNSKGTSQRHVWLPKAPWKALPYPQLNWVTRHPSLSCRPLTCTTHPLCPSPQPPSEPCTPFPSLLPTLSLPGPLLVLVLPPLCSSPATICSSWLKVGAILSTPVLPFPSRTSSPPQTAHRHYLSVPGCPRTSSMLPPGQALKLLIPQNCFLGDPHIPYSSRSITVLPVSQPLLASLPSQQEPM